MSGVFYFTFGPHQKTAFAVLDPLVFNLFGDDTVFLHPVSAGQAIVFSWDILLAKLFISVSILIPFGHRAALLGGDIHII